MLRLRGVGRPVEIYSTMGRLYSIPYTMHGRSLDAERPIRWDLLSIFVYRINSVHVDAAGICRFVIRTVELISCCYRDGRDTYWILSTSYMSIVDLGLAGVLPQLPFGAPVLTVSLAGAALSAIVCARPLE